MLAFVILLLLAATAATLATRALLHDLLDIRITASLREEIAEFNRLRGSIENEDLAGVDVDDDLRSLFDAFLSIDPPPEGEQLVTVVEGVAYRSAGVEGTGHDLAGDAELLARMIADPGRVGLVQTPAGPVRYLAEPVTVDGESGHFVATAFVAEEQREIESLIRISTMVIFGCLLLGTVSTFMIVGRVFSPLRRLTSAARRISETDLSQRMEVTGSDEFAELGHTFNEMLGRLDHGFSTQQLLMRDIGHELRTPLAIASGHLEFVPRTKENAETLAIVQGEHIRMRRLIDDLLVLARSEQRDFLQMEMVDLALLVPELMERARHLAERDWQTSIDEAGKVIADPERLTQAMVSLIDNAVKHTDTGDRINIGARCRDGNAMLWVLDTGPGVPEADRERIFESFERGRQEQRGTGTGLGLAIAKRIAHAHAGSITVDRPPGGGSRFTITIPIDPPEPEEQP